MKLIILTTFLISSFSAFAFHPPYKQAHANFIDGHKFFSDSGIRGPSYKDQVLNLKKIADENTNATYIHYGDTVKKRPLSGILFTPKNSNPQRLAIITGATHGNEYLNIVDRLPEALLNSKQKRMQEYLQRGGAVFFVPILNPDGYESRARSNANWADLNRDWPNPANSHREFRQPESKALATWVKNYVNQNNLKVDIAVDYHCCVKGMLLLPWGYKKGEYMGTLDAQLSLEIQNLFKSAFVKYGKIGTPPDVLYSAVGTSLDYWYDQYGAVSFTYEGRRNTEVNYLKEHVTWWNSIFDQF